jgi:S-adenosylmethionine hydrolase
MSRQPPYEHNFVALLSDFGHESFYVGVMKAVVAGAAPEAFLVDITHDIAPYAVDEAGFILRTVFPYFPPGTIFLAVVDPGVGGERSNLIFRMEDRYLIAPDNGLVTDLSNAYPMDACWTIDDRRIAAYCIHPPVGNTFLGRDIFAPAAGAIASGVPPEGIGIRMDGAVETINIPPLVTGKNRIEGYGRFVDRFGNILTDITGDHLNESFGANASTGIRVRIGDRIVRGIHRCYVDEPLGTLMVVLNSWNRIEVSVSRGRADEALSVTRASEMHIVLEL